VTGPHRSGTTICARMIAADTGHDLVIEDDFGFAKLPQLAAFIQSNYAPIVVQCPFLADIIHDLKYLIDLDMDEVLVVFMHRYLRDIIASEDRTRVDFNSMGNAIKKRINAESDQHVSDIRYEAWSDQCQVIPHALDVGYESMRQHYMWLEDRKQLPFGHDISRPRLPQVFIDGINAAQNV
jgi:hypothetical protein